MNDETSFRKTQPRRSSEWEAAGLTWLRAAETEGGARTVRVHDVSDAGLTLERLDQRSPSASVAREFGAALAHTHTAGAPAGFGTGPVGDDGQSWNGHGLQGPAGDQIDLKLASAGEFESWGAMYGDLRIAPLVRAAGSHYGAAERAAFGALVERLRSGDFDDDDAPARIHGDLWSGNLLWTSNGAVLIDPVAYAGHREDDLAALALFGAPYFDDIVAGYESVHRLEPGWQRRVRLHQLHLLLLHAVLFGGGYAGQALEAARQYT